MKRKTKVKVVGRIDNAEGATVTIDPNSGLISVRPRGRHRDYTLPLEDVARAIVYKVVVAEANEGQTRVRKVKRGVL